MKIPTKITPSPLAEVAVDVKFETALPSDAVFGFVYDSFIRTHPKLVKLPILQIPDEIRTQDPKFKYQPYYQFISESSSLQIGPKILSLVVSQYPGWDKLREEMMTIYEVYQKKEVFYEIKRIGLRYINFFENINILDETVLFLQYEKKNLSKSQTYIHTIIEEDPYYSSDLRISNMVNFTQGHTLKTGSIIDIDAHTQDQSFLSKIEMKSLLDKQNSIANKIFFSLLTPRFIQTLNPQYDEE